MDKIKIYLTKDEKAVIRQAAANNCKPPKTMSVVMFLFVLSMLKDKGLVEYKSNYDEVYSLKVTIKGAALLESNPELTNPFNWKEYVIIGATVVTAIATTLNLVHCS